MNFEQAQPCGIDDDARILVVRLGAVGDVVRTLPAVRLVRRTWPGARIAWAVERGSAPLLEGHPDLDDVFVFQRRWGDAWPFVKKLRGFCPTHSLDFQSSLKAGAVARLSGAGRRIGFARGHDRESSHLFANVQVRLVEPRIHRVARACALVQAVGAREGPLEADLGLSARELERGRGLAQKLAVPRPLVALACFSSRRQAYKRYPLDRWGQIARGLAEQGAGVLILGGPGEQEEMEQIRGMAGPDVAESVAICPPTDIRQLAALIAACDQLIGGDTGPMHLGWAVGLPVLAIYGPTDPVLNAPFGKGHVVLATPERTGREDADRFAGITPELVLDKARRQRDARAGNSPHAGHSTETTR